MTYRICYFCLVLDLIGFTYALYHANEIFIVFCCFFSMTDIQNARDLMDVLAEMLNALDPGNREVFFSDPHHTPWHP